MNKSKKSLVVVGAMVMAYALAFPQSVSAGQKLPTNGKAQPPRKAAAQEAGEKAAGDGGREGIKVHGHWAIEIRNQDGTVAAHREFENSLVGQGQFFLAALLSRHYTTGIWQVSVNSSAGNGPCSPAECLIMEALPPGVTSQKIGS